MEGAGVPVVREIGLKPRAREEPGGKRRPWCGGCGLGPWATTWRPLGRHLAVSYKGRAHARPCDPTGLVKRSESEFTRAPVRVPTPSLVFCCHQSSEPGQVSTSREPTNTPQYDASSRGHSLTHWTRLETWGMPTSGSWGHSPPGCREAPRERSRDGAHRPGWLSGGTLVPQGPQASSDPLSLAKASLSSAGRLGPRADPPRQRGSVITMGGEPVRPHWSLALRGPGPFVCPGSSKTLLSLFTDARPDCQPGDQPRTRSPRGAPQHQAPPV